MSAQPENLFGSAANDADAQETREWMDALSAVIQSEGRERAHFLLEQLLEQARQDTASTCRSRPPRATSTPSSPADEERCPGNLEIEERLRAYMRWNAMAMVVKANRLHPEPTAATSAATSAPSRRWRPCSAPASTTSGTPRARTMAATASTSRATVSPGIYARAYLEGRITEEQLLNFRQEVDGKGLSSYPHPKLMPEFWQFPTVSMGLGPLMAIYQARFLKYLHARGIANTENRKVWVFLRRRRDGRSRIAGRHRRGGAREAGQPDLRRQLQPAAPGRPGARQRQDHPGARRRIPRRRLERHQADLGQLLGPAAGPRQGRHPAQDHDGDARRRLPGHEGQRRRLRAQELLRPRSQGAGDGRQDERRGHLAPEPRRPRSAEGLRRLPQGREPQGPADGAADQDRQGLRHGQGRRGPQHRPPGQEADRRRHPHLPRPLQHPDPGQTSWPRSRSTSRPTTRRRCSTCTSAARRWAATCPAPHQGRRAVQGARRSTPSRR
jgi:hypothetical protein